MKAHVFSALLDEYGSEEEEVVVQVHGVMVVVKLMENIQVCDCDVIMGNKNITREVKCVDVEAIEALNKRKVLLLKQ